MNPTRDEILRLLFLVALKSVDGLTDVDVRNILKYSEAFELTDDLQIPYVGYVKSLIADTGKTVVEGDQSDVITENEQGVLPALFLTDETIWRAQYTIGEDTLQIDQSMLQSGSLYGFPDPETTNFTYKIIYI